MDFLLLALDLVILLCIYLNHRATSRRLKGVEDLIPTTRQTTMKQATYGSHATPTVDSKARTTRRDTDDLPPTGRMGRLSPRQGGELLDSPTNDH